jgi:hypothetical protein
MLMELWIEQNGRCAYTNVELVPGFNASLDHKTPPMKGGSNEKSNLQWVDYRINTMKYNQTHEEFLRTCRFICGRFGEESDDISHLASCTGVSMYRRSNGIQE